MSDQIMPAAPVRFSLGSYRFEYNPNAWPKWRRWSCERHGHGIPFQPTPVHAWLYLRRWEKQRETDHA